MHRCSRLCATVMLVVLAAAGAFAAEPAPVPAVPLPTAEAARRRALTEDAETFERLSRLQTLLRPLLQQSAITLRKLMEAGPPFQRTERLARLLHLSSVLDAPDTEPAEKYRMSIEAYRVELDYARTIEAYRGTLPDNGDARLVDFLSVGRLALYYQTLDGKDSGLWLNDSRRWLRLSEEENERLIEALRAARKQIPPDLVALPLPGPEPWTLPPGEEMLVPPAEHPPPDAAPRDLDARLRAARVAAEPLLLQIRESAAALQPHYTERLPAGDASRQRALLAALANPTHVPAIEELAELFASLITQIDALGRSYQRMETVYRSDGRATQQPVLRVGGFGWFADGRYLVYSPEVDKLLELNRQPSKERLESAAAYARTPHEAIATVAIDPTGGQTLQLIVQVPDLGERISQGGPVGYLILALGCGALALSGYRFVRLHRTERAIGRQLDIPEPQSDNPLGRILTTLQAATGKDSESLTLAAEQALLTEQEQLERSLPMLRLLASIAPMLGLLGTVTGMIATFQAIALHGSGDPKLMSGGISEALVTTVEGLVTAIPILLVHSVLVTKSARMTSVLEAQSAAAIARRIENDPQRRPSPIRGEQDHSEGSA